MNSERDLYHIEAFLQSPQYFPKQYDAVEELSVFLLRFSAFRFAPDEGNSPSCHVFLSPVEYSQQFSSSGGVPSVVTAVCAL